MISPGRWAGITAFVAILSIFGLPLVQGREFAFQLNAPGEGIAEITASSVLSSPHQRKTACVLAKGFIDDHYNQDIFLYQGSREWTYRVFLGPLGPGLHRLRLERNRQDSTPNTDLEIRHVKVWEVEKGEPGYQAMAHAPILYARADTIGQMDDIPLLMLYERSRRSGRTAYQYSVIFSNEDGGTSTAKLMAQWGRTTDIEMAYRLVLGDNGRIVKETIQSYHHKLTSFQGSKEGRHPHLLVATRNNLFSDRGETTLQYRLAPIKADLTGGSRELLMDRFPWTYQLMAQELLHEGKICQEVSCTNNAINDPRWYIYVELNVDNRESGVVVWVKLKSQSRWFSSFRGERSFIITRSGWVRTAIGLPPGSTTDSIDSIAIQCARTRESGNRNNREYRGNSQCTILGISKVFLLDKIYHPGTSLMHYEGSRRLHPGEMVSFNHNYWY